MVGLPEHQYFGYGQTMNANPVGEGADLALATVAACLAEPARARMLCCLMDGHARTATELATVGEVTASTASGHLSRLVAQGFVKCAAQGRHRYYSVANADVGMAVESLLVIAGRPLVRPFAPTTPEPLREARRCYDHLAGYWAVQMHDHAVRNGWMSTDAAQYDDYALTPLGTKALAALGVNVELAQSAKRRRFACPCMDWSERRPHLGGALGAALLGSLLDRKWLEPELDSRVLRVSKRGKAGLRQLLNVQEPQANNAA